VTVLKRSQRVLGVEPHERLRVKPTAASAGVPVPGEV